MEDYHDHLLRDGPADGLEVLLTSLALNMNINIVIDDLVWATSHTGIDFKCATVLLATTSAFACLTVDSLAGNLADVDTLRTCSSDQDHVSENVQQVDADALDQTKGGHPLTVEKDTTSDSGSTTDTNPDNEFVTLSVPCKKHVMMKKSCQLCPVCSIGLSTKGALCFHLKNIHPDSHLFACLQCDSSFNNRSDLAAHIWSIHSVKKVKCKHCVYSMTSGAQMQIHVRTHTSGLKCKKCGKSYPNARLLKEHLRGISQQVLEK